MWRRFFARLYNFFRGEGAEREMTREIASHLALLEDDFERRGMTPEEARAAARRVFGGVEQAKELHRDERSLVWLEQVWQDMRHASRSLSKSLGFTLVAVMTLALGIGVNTTLFTAYNAVALKPLPVSDPNEVVRIKRWFESAGAGDIQYTFSYPEYVYCRDHNDVFSSLIAGSWPVPVLAQACKSAVESERLRAQLVSANYFTDLGIGVRLGRTFLPEEDQTPGADPVVVLSYSYWQRRFRGDPQILEKAIKLNGAAFTIIGVAPQEFTGTSVLSGVPDFWAPLSMQAQLAPGRDWLHEPDDHQLQILARLKPSVTIQHARAQAAGLVRQFVATYKERDRTKTITLEHATFFGNTDDIRFKALVAALMAIVGMVLLVACANLANMLLARGAARQREIGVRLALGASRGRVIRHLLTESILLSLLGGMAGLVLSLWTSKLLWVAIEQLLAAPFIGSITVGVSLDPDARVFAYALALSVVTGVLFGLSPALQCTKPDLTTALKDEGASFGQRLSRSRLRGLLIGAQVTVSMVLLVSAGLLMRGLLQSYSADPGFEMRRAYMLFGAFGNDSAKAAALERRLFDRLQTLPQLKSVARGGRPMSGTWTPPIIVEGPQASRGRTLASYASETYFDTLGIPLVRGRGFTKQEAEQGPRTAGAGSGFTRQGPENGARVAVISEATAHRFWPAEDPIGKRFTRDMDFRGEIFAEFEVIGVAKDIRFANLTRLDPAHVYLATNAADLNGILFRVQGDPKDALAAVRNAVGETDKNLLPGLVLSSVEEGPLRLQKSLARAYAMFAAVLAALALTLAGVGIYGVMAYLVSQRVREIGIRVALGATPGGVLQAVVLQGLRPVFVGIVLGIAGAAGLSWILHATLVFPGSTDFFYGVPFYDPVTFLGLSCFVASVAALASAVPALRALRIDPTVALRHE